MNNQEKYTFAEITWVVGYNGYNEKLYVIPTVYSGKFLEDFNGNEIYCENIKDGVKKLLNKFELEVAPRHLSFIDENSIISGYDLFKLCIYGLKEKATIYANNFYYGDIVFNSKDYYNVKVLSKEFTAEKLHLLGRKATKAIRNYEVYQEKLREDIKKRNNSKLTSEEIQEFRAQAELNKETIIKGSKKLNNNDHTNNL